MPHPWLIVTPSASPPTPAALEGVLRACEPPLTLHAEMAPEGPGWDTLAFGPPGEAPSLFLEAEPTGEPDNWLVQAELARWRRDIATLPACAGRLEAQRRLATARWLFAIHLMPVPPEASPMWQASEALAATLAAAPGALMWVAGAGCNLDGVPLEGWR
ncbi:MAG: hypothetical protein VKS61_06595 [Candidatus Sericytochromatia bacterium]|nr:hypothetical protein [Candidatus Sericytochromatia bacterium]